MKRHLLKIIIIALVITGVYSNTMYAPFHYDDDINIRDNPLIRDLGHFLDPSMIKAHRYFGQLSFAFNYRLHSFWLPGYHIGNILIHILNALLIYMLVLQMVLLLRKRSGIEESAGAAYAPFFIALLFAVHPLQTQAVTYIVQRFTSLAAFFYLLTIFIYMLARSGSGRRSRIVLYVLSVGTAFAAMRTKEISFTLPLMLFLVESTFFSSGTRKKFVNLLPYFLLLLFMAFTMVNLGAGFDETIVSIDKASRAHTGASRIDYLLTQFTVIVKYISLLIFPVNQNLDYDYQLYGSFFVPQVFMSFLVIAAILAISIYLYRRSSSVQYERKLIAFGFFWFFIANLVESSVIPIVDVIYEHRVYLPSAGFFIAAGFSVVYVYDRVSVRARKAIVAACIIVLSVLAVSTFSRNLVWQSEESLWADVVRKSPRKARGYVNLSQVYIDKKELERARGVLETALELDPDYPEAHNNLGSVYSRSGEYDRAIQEFRTAISLSPAYAKAYNNLGLAYIKKGLVQEGVESLLEAVRMDPDNKEAYNNLGNIYAEKGMYEEATGYFLSALRIDQEYAEAYFNLGMMYGKRGMKDRAISNMEKAVRIRPDYPEAHNNLGIIYKNTEKPEQALEHYRAALSLQPENVQYAYNMANALMLSGNIDDAIMYYKKVLALDPSYVSARYNLGVAYKRKGAVDLAIEQFSEFVRNMPEETGGHLNLALLYIQKGQIRQAQTELERTLKIEPGNKDARKILLEIGRRNRK